MQTLETEHIQVYCHLLTQ